MSAGKVTARPDLEAAAGAGIASRRASRRDGGHPRGLAGQEASGATAEAQLAADLGRVAARVSVAAAAATLAISGALCAADGAMSVKRRVALRNAIGAKNGEAAGALPRNVAGAALRIEQALAACFSSGYYTPRVALEVISAAPSKAN